MPLRKTPVLVIFFTFCCPAAEVQADLVPPTVVQSRLEAGNVKLRERQDAIRRLFADAGCAPEEQRVGRKTANVICTLPGQTSGTIIVGGHLDFIEAGHGIVDDWSGTSLLPSLYQALKAKPRRHTYVFVAFNQEEDGLIGSRKYVKSLSDEDKSAIRAFVNLECLGLGPANVWVHRSSPVLLKHLKAVANAVHVPIRGVDVDQVGDDDTHPFASAHIAVISLHSITQETFPILHTARDRLDAVHADQYHESYKLIAFYFGVSGREGVTASPSRGAFVYPSRPRVRDIEVEAQAASSHFLQCSRFTVNLSVAISLMKSPLGKITCCEPSGLS